MRKTRATDVYAYGILVFEVRRRSERCSGTERTQAYSGRGPWAVLRESLMQGFPPSRPRAGSSAVARGLDDGMWDMCTRCWALDPVNRPSMRDVVRAYDGHAFPSPAVRSPDCTGSPITQTMSDARLRQESSIHLYGGDPILLPHRP